MISSGCFLADWLSKSQHFLTCCKPLNHPHLSLGFQRAPSSSGYHKASGFIGHTPCTKQPSCPDCYLSRTFDKGQILKPSHLCGKQALCISQCIPRNLRDSSETQKLGWWGEYWGVGANGDFGPYSTLSLNHRASTSTSHVCACVSYIFELKFNCEIGPPPKESLKNTRWSLFPRHYLSINFCL